MKKAFCWISALCILALTFALAGRASAWQHDDPVMASDAFLVNSTSDGAQSSPDAIAHGSGYVAVVFESDRLSGSQAAWLLARDISYQGVPANTDVNFSIAGSLRQYGVKLAPVGSGFAGVWAAQDSGEETTKIRLRFSGVGGAVNGAPFTLTADRDKYEPSVAALAGDEVLVVYQAVDNPGDPAAQGQSIFGQKVSYNGEMRGEAYRISAASNLDRNRGPAGAARLANGMVAVVYQASVDSVSHIYLQMLSSDGSRIGEPSQVNTVDWGQCYTPKLAALAGGGFVVIWARQKVLDGNAWTDIAARVFDANGTGLSGEFNASRGQGQANLQPAVTALGNGGFAIAYARGDLQEGMYVQCMTANGAKIGGEVEVYRTDPAAGRRQIEPAMASYDSNRFLVAWSSDNLDPGSGVAGRVLALGGVEGFIARLYRYFYNVEPSAEHLDAYFARLTGDGDYSASQMAAYLYEYQNFSGFSDSDFVYKMYLAILNRYPTNDELSLWEAAFTHQSAERDDLFWGLVYSAEFRALADALGISAY